jgi:L-threonylcarbamoyladenylate synthase
LTSTLQVSSSAPEPHLIAQAAQVIRDGGLVAFPTETVYGLGANALDPQAIDRIFSAKGRPATDPLIVHIAHQDQLNDLAHDIPQLAFELGKRLWPGPLTLVLKRNPGVPANLSAGRDTVAVRQPAHPVAAALIESAGVPIAAPSANLFSHPSPTTAAHVLHDLDGRLDLILDGGPTLIGVESTVLDLTTPIPTLLRPGGISVETLRELIPDLITTQRTLSIDEAASAPGQLLKHYSPATPLRLFTGPRDSVLEHLQQLITEDKRIGLLLPNDDLSQFSASPILFFFPLGLDLPTIAHNLFNGLRELDSLNLDLILTRDLGREGLALAIWDRLFRAAEGKVIEINSGLNPKGLQDL